MDINQVLEVLKNSNGRFINDHSNGLSSVSISREEVAKVLVKYTSAKGETHLCLAHRDVGFCINPLYVKDGRVHLSRWSVGGVVHVGAYEDLDEAVRVYNQDSASSKFFKEGCDQINEIITL